jgi:hypothetical protein
LAAVTLEELNPADLEMESEEENQVWEGGALVFSITHATIDLVEGRIIRGGSAERVCHVLDADHHRVDIDRSRITGGKRGLT